LITLEHLRGDLGELVAGTVPKRQNDQEITVFKSLGLAIEDLVCAKHVYDKVKQEQDQTQTNSVHFHSSL